MNNGRRRRIRVFFEVDARSKYSGADALLLEQANLWVDLKK